MTTVTISKEEYTKLKRQATAYRCFVLRIFEDAVYDPVEDTVKDFKDTGIYSRGFIADLEEGLRKSSYGKRHGNISHQK